MQEALVSVDAGGIKTEICVKSVKSLAGGPVRRHRFGGSNYKTVGLARARDSLKDGVLRACAKEGVPLEEARCAVCAT